MWRIRYALQVLKDDRGIGVVEVILILVVLIGLVIIFKSQLTSLVRRQSLKKSPVKVREFKLLCIRKKRPAADYADTEECRKSGRIGTV